MTASHRTVVRGGVAAAVVALALTGCSTAVTGTGRQAAAASGGGGAASPTEVPSYSGGPTAPAVGAVPSGAPAEPAGGAYGDQTPERASWLYAFDRSTDVDAMTAQGTTTVQGVTVTVQCTLGVVAGGTDVSQCTLGVAGASAAVLTSGQTLDVQAPAAFWTAIGVAPDLAAQAGDRWATIGHDSLTIVGAFTSLSRLLITFEPEQSDSITTGTEDGGATYTVANATDGYTTLIDHDSGLITGIRTSAGTLQIGYPAGEGPDVTLPAAGDTVAVAGI